MERHSGIVEVRIVRAQDRWPLPWFVSLIVGVQVILILLVNRLARVADVDGTVCLFKRATGIPCAGCRGTRAGISLLRGDPLGAFAWNPLLATVFLGFVAYSTLRVFGKRTIALRLSGREFALAIPLLLVAILANWAYVIQRGG